MQRLNLPECRFGSTRWLCPGFWRGNGSVELVLRRIKHADSRPQDWDVIELLYETDVTTMPPRSFPQSAHNANRRTGRRVDDATQKLSRKGAESSDPKTTSTAAILKSHCCERTSDVTIVFALRDHGKRHRATCLHVTASLLRSAEGKPASVRPWRRIRCPTQFDPDKPTIAHVFRVRRQIRTLANSVSSAFL